MIGASLIGLVFTERFATWIGTSRSAAMILDPVSSGVESQKKAFLKILKRFDLPAPNRAEKGEEFRAIVLILRVKNRQTKTFGHSRLRKRAHERGQIFRSEIGSRATHINERSFDTTLVTRSGQSFENVACALETAPGVSVKDVLAQTEATLIVPDPVMQMSLEAA